MDKPASLKPNSFKEHFRGTLRVSGVSKDVLKSINIVIKQSAVYLIYNRNAFLAKKLKLSSNIEIHDIHDVPCF